MAENTKSVQSDARDVATTDEDINGPELAPFRYIRSNVPKADLFSDDPIPLFLTGPNDGLEPQSPERASGYPRTARRRTLAGLLAASAAVIVFALTGADATRAVVVNAKASFAGGPPSQLNTAPSDNVQTPARNTQSSNPDLSGMPDVETTGSILPLAAQAVTPTREQIAAAYQAALQSQSQLASRELPASAPPARRLDSDELAALLKRARSLIAIGDIASARLLLERAADAQEASAALMLARTYDPAVLGTPDARSVTPDPAAARIWYRRAAELGSPDAQQRLAQIQE